MNLDLFRNASGFNAVNGINKNEARLKRGNTGFSTEFLLV